jgi:L-lactate dehydrogenase complex protein LldG
MAGEAMSARDKILARVTRATGGGDKVAVATRLGHHQSETAPIPAAAQTVGPTRIKQFIEKAVAVDATISRIGSLDDLPKSLAEELRSRNLPAAIRTGHDPIFERDWGTVEHTTGPGRLDESATLSRAHLAMAETGTVVLASGSENPVTLTFLGETHFVVIAAEDIKAGFEDMWAEWRMRGLDPRTVNLVTGPSRSADIGQTLQLGAHGPVALHVFVVG